jgi:ADP-dependent NAD(P)H-hydrate dehydratase / NAD(P)H-hydrate epimerase
MKVVTPKEMAACEKKAYADGFSDEAFMEEAGIGIAKWVDLFAKINREKTITLLCGKGNNSGDAYAAGCHLLQKGYKVHAIQITPIEQSSPLCRKNHQRFLNNQGRIDTKLRGILLDGLFGTGFHGTLEEPYASLVTQANQSHLPIIAIDIPSGLNGETGEVSGPAIQAMETLYLGLPKTGFFLREGWNHVGKLNFVDFGIKKTYLEQAKTSFNLITEVALPPVKRNRQKYETGHVAGLAGSPGMPGAALLASSAALKGGAGILHLLHPAGMESELANSLYEVIKIPYTSAELVLEKINRAKAAFIGPGIGRSPNTRTLLKTVLSDLSVPSVIDADALTLIAEDNLPLPKQAILTPHHGEMARLLKTPLKPDFIEQCQAYAEKNQITLVLKGGPTFIFQPQTPPLVNGTGGPGMAKAGSGDVLTGLIAALLAQGFAPYEAASTGVYLHGVAGEAAEREKTAYGTVASDIIVHFPEAFSLFA